MSQSCLITGASGAIGFSVLENILDRGFEQVFCTFRSDRSLDGVRQALKPADRTRIIPIMTDLSDPSSVEVITREVNTFKDSSSYECLVVHCAADVSWTKSLEDIAPANVDGTRHLLKAAHQLWSRCRIVYFSTAYADYEHGNHRNTYEQTKERAESMVRETASSEGSAVLIIRASLVVGCGSGGFVYRFNGIYSIIRLIASNEVPCIVGNSIYEANLIPIDWVIDEMWAGLENLEWGNVKHITLCADRGIPIEELIKRTQIQANKLRNENQLEEYTEMTVISRRQYEFLMRSADSWELSEYFRRMQTITDIIEGYIKHSETARQMLSAGNSTPPPQYEDFIEPVISYWIAKHQNKVLSTKEPAWLKWRSKGA